MSQFTKQTQKIVDAHKNDFNCTNFNKIMKQKGGYNAYVKSLGGVFAKYINKNSKITTIKEFQEVAEYVFGLMAIWGFDYNNNKKYVKWGGGSPFYINGTKGKCNKAKIDEMCSGKKSCTTNCNYGADALFYKCGLEGGSGQFTSCSNYKSQINTYKGQIIRKKINLKPGDLVHFFNNKCEGTNPNKWSGWGHMAVVGEVSEDTIVMYDAGSYCIKHGIYKRSIQRKNGNEVEEGWKDWVGVRLFNLKDDEKLKNKTDSDLAIEVLHNYYGSGTARKENLGSRYEAVQELVNKFIDSKYREEYIYAGTGQSRKQFLGKDYDDTQNKINEIIKIADEILKGKYWKEHVNQKDYELIQAQINTKIK